MRQQTYRLDRILCYYDVPQIILSSDEVGTHYLSVLFDDEQTLQYISIPISSKRLEDLLSARLDLRGAFIHPEVNKYIIMEVRENESSTLHYIGELNELNDDRMLAEEGFFLCDLVDLTDIQIKRESIEIGAPVIYLGFVDNHNSHHIPIDSLSWHIDAFRRFLHHTSKKRLGTDISREKIMLYGTEAASFNLKMYVDTDLDLFGASPIDSILSDIGALICDNDDELFKTQLENYKGHAFRALSTFLESLHVNNTELKYRWSNGTIADKPTVYRLTSQRISHMLNIMKASDIDQGQSEFFVGCMTAININSKTWSLTEISSNKTIKGTTLSASLLSGLVIEEEIYQIECEVYIENKIGKSPKKEYILTSIHPLNIITEGV